MVMERKRGWKSRTFFLFLFLFSPLFTQHSSFLPLSSLPPSLPPSSHSSNGSNPHTSLSPPPTPPLPNTCVLARGMANMVRIAMGIAIAWIALTSVITIAVYTTTTTTTSPSTLSSHPSSQTVRIDPFQGNGEELAAAVSYAAAYSATMGMMMNKTESEWVSEYLPRLEVGYVGEGLRGAKKWADGLGYSYWRAEDAVVVFPSNSGMRDKESVERGDAGRGWPGEARAGVLETLPRKGDGSVFGSWEEWEAFQARVVEVVAGDPEGVLDPVEPYKEMWGVSYGPEYAGNTQQRMGVVEVEGIPVLVKRKNLDNPVYADEVKRLRESGDAGEAVKALMVSEVEKIPSIMRVVNECGFAPLVPQSWIGKVEGIPTMFAVLRPGATLELLRGKPRVVYPAPVRNVFRRIKSWQVRLMALHDLVLAYSDRHFANILVDEEYNLSSIDSFQHTFLSPDRETVNSVFIPFTTKYATHRLSFEVLFGKQRSLFKFDDPTVTLDYRCHTRGSRIGTDFPPQLSTCLARFANAEDARGLQSDLGLTSLSQAEYLQTVSRSLLRHGFEHTVASVFNASLIDLPEDPVIPYLQGPFLPCCALLGNVCLRDGVRGPEPWDLPRSGA